MIHLIVARHNDEIFKGYLESSLEKFKGLGVLVHQIRNNEKHNSMFSKYNLGIEMANPQDDDILVFIHEDVKILDENFCKKLELVFNKKPDVGLVGLIGTTSFPEAGGWWLCDHSLHRGALIQGKPGTSGKETFHMVRKKGYFEDLVSVDGFCFAVRGSVLKDLKFDEETYPEAFHFYDVDFCFSILEKGWDIATCDILLEHASEGPLPESWFKNKERFLNKWKSKTGYMFPITKEQFKK